MKVSTFNKTNGDDVFTIKDTVGGKIFCQLLFEAIKHILINFVGDKIYFLSFKN